MPPATPETQRNPLPPAPGRTSSSSGRNLWVSGLSSTTRATDLKNLFNKYGKVCFLLLSLSVACEERTQ